MARVDQEQKREQIRALLLLGTMSYRAIAREVGVSDGTVRKMAKDCGIAKVNDQTPITGAAIDALAQIRNGAQGAQQAQVTIQDLLVVEHLKNKLMFVQKSWETLFKAQEFAGQKIAVATVAAEKFEPLLKELIQLLKEQELQAYHVKEILVLFGTLMDIPLNHVSTYVGTIYDKMALAVGEPTSHQKQEVRGQVTQRYEYEITERIINDPEARATARDLFRRAVGGDLEN